MYLVMCSNPVGWNTAESRCSGQRAHLLHRKDQRFRTRKSLRFDSKRE